MPFLALAYQSLDGLSVGDALGERFFGRDAQQRLERRELPAAPWSYTDDTEMALSVVEVLAQYGRIEPDALAQAFARRYTPWRGYGPGAHRLLQAFQQGADWQTESARLFGGSGSYGNGGAMRVAPVGAYWGQDLAAAREDAERSARVTHSHPEGIAGAIAVAIAAAIATCIGQGERERQAPFWSQLLAWVPKGETRRGLERAAAIPYERLPPSVAAQLGAGERVSAQDTVPFAIWCAARHLDSYPDAFWATASGLGDRDTTCAIAGGIVAPAAQDVPPGWLAAREPLPALAASNRDG